MEESYVLVITKKLIRFRVAPHFAEGSGDRSIVYQLKWTKSEDFRVFISGILFTVHLSAEVKKVSAHYVQT